MKWHVIRPGTALAVVLGILPGLLRGGEVLTQVPAVVPSQVKGGPTPVPPPRAVPRDRFKEAPPTAWIWGADPNRRYLLRKEFEAEPALSTLRATCDNRMVLKLNGKEIARSEEWQEPVAVDLTPHLKRGQNVLVAEVTNDGGPAGFVMQLVIGEGKAARYVVSDATWQASPAQAEPAWENARTVAKFGDAPWGQVFTEMLRGGSTASNVFTLLPGFQVERLFTVPRDRLGSWVSITFDDRGRLLACDQEGKGLCRITPPPLGSSEPTRVEPLEVKVSGAQGMLYAFGSLYLSVNGGPGSGLYRLRDTRGNGQFDDVKKLATFHGGGEHGPHGLRLSPDGRSLLVVCGNHTRPPDRIDASRVPRPWAEDLLLPRQWDANGHARGILAPGGWIARTDPEGKTWEIVSIGYRNAYDIAFNAEGELFAYDSDMEWDMGMPWYRPTRVTHATSGSEFGWRSGSGKWPNSHIDSLPPLVDIGPGSPVGVEFGYGTRFPARYQKALYVCDWTFGTMYALHLEPSGSTYRAEKEEFVSRSPLPLTDAAVGPDGALYFTIGGRGTQSELFRVTYMGKEATTKVEYRDPHQADLRTLRRQMEALHTPGGGPETVEQIWPHLSHDDRFIRYAARVALEHRPVALWRERVLSENDPERLLQGAVALARQGPKEVQPQLLEALRRLSWANLSESQRLAWIRALGLTFLRQGEPSPKVAASLASSLDPVYPGDSAEVNRELCALLVYLKSPTVLGKTITLMRQVPKSSPTSVADDLLARNRGYGGPIAAMQANAPDLQKLHYAFVLRNVREGWTLEQRTIYFGWLNEARKRSGGASYQGFLNNIEKEAFDNATDADRLAIEAAGLRKPFRLPELPKAKGPGRDWTVAELVSFAEPRLKGRDFAKGQAMFGAARCVVCHRFNAEGGATGPDLTQLAGRFTLRDLAESILDPSKVVSDQYRASEVTTKTGKPYVGKIVSETAQSLILVIDPEDSTKTVELKKSALEEVKPSLVSLMPKDLLKTLNENEVLDLLAYLLSRGDRGHAMFRR